MESDDLYLYTVQRRGGTSQIFPCSHDYLGWGWRVYGSPGGTGVLSQLNPEGVMYLDTNRRRFIR